MPELSWNRYGKARVRVVKVRRPPGKSDQPHQLIDLTLDVQLEGAFDAVYVDGDNAPCIATDTMKNTVYALARQDPLTHVETFAARLADHFIGKPAVSRVRITAAEHRWDRLAAHAFVQPGGEQWTTTVTRDRDGTDIASGVADLVLMKTTDSAFSGFPRDAYTTLPETEDRVLATALTATWTYRRGTSDFSVRERVRQALVDAFAAHRSRSVQHTMYAMGEAALAACADATSITLTMPNRHHLLVDLKPFGLDNPNEVFVATDQPYGLIEATITRSAEAWR
ncbi:MAG TPA: urate oxidase, partial [Vicinamibacterales bacterium]|nr:urate oxidase [Vicinamibacterales bacterium]